MESVSVKNTLLPLTLLQVLSNSLILHHTAPHLTISSLLTLAATSKGFRALIHDTPGVFRYANLTGVKAAQFQIAAIDHGGEVWRNVQMDEHITEDDFYGGPLQGIFTKMRRRNIMRDVQTLVLDGLSVTADLVSEIILQDNFHVRILSIREVQNMNERKLQQALIYAVRPTRAEGSPRLQSLYIFGTKDSQHTLKGPTMNELAARTSTSVGSSGGVMHSQGAQLGAEWNQKSANSLAEEMNKRDVWYERAGPVFAKQPSVEWANTMRACEGIISFDAVLCRGPRHSASVVQIEPNSARAWYFQLGAAIAPRVATSPVGGCHGCGSAPEGYSRFGVSPIDQFPLLAPPPLHSSTPRAAKTPSNEILEKKFIARCTECLRNRHCESCHKWWCEDCYEVPNHPSNAGGSLQSWQIEEGQPDFQGHAKQKVKPGVQRSCFECGPNCADCVKRTQLMCKLCGGGYCSIHNEGSTLTTAVRLYAEPSLFFSQTILLTRGRVCQKRSADTGDVLMTAAPRWANPQT